MNDQQNIDDILKLLKSSYNDDDSSENVELPEGKKKEKKLSDDELHNKLKSQFMGDAEKATDTYESDDFSYTIDSDFLEESRSLSVDDASSDGDDMVDALIEEELEAPFDEKNGDNEIFDEPMSEEEMLIEEEIVIEEDDGLPPFDMPEEPLAAVESGGYEVSEEEGIEEAVEEELLLNCESALDDDCEDGVFVENEDGELVFVSGSATDDCEDGVFVENEDGELVFVSGNDGAESEPIDDILALEEEADGEILGSISEEEISELLSEDMPEIPTESEKFFSDESGQLALFETNINSAPEAENPEKSEEVPTEVDEAQMVIDFGDAEDEEPIVSLEENSEAETESVEDDIFEGLDESVIGLMCELGDISPEAMKDERVTEYLSKAEKAESETIDPSDAFAFEGEEYESESQNEELIYAYRREKKFTLLRTLGCGLFAAILFAYELTGMLEIDMEGILSYVEYPAIYALIGLQLFIFAAAFAWRELFSGIKKAFSFKATPWSLISLVAVFNIVYGLIIAIMSPDTFSHMFGTVSALYVFWGLLSEYLEVSREAKCFSVYSADNVKYTFDSERRIGSAAEKMYRGGLPMTKRVLEPVKIEFPKGYFFAVNSSRVSDTFVNYSITPIIVISAIALLVNVFISNSAELAFGAFMTSLTLLCPISAIFIHTFPMWHMTSKLSKKSSAVAGEKMALKYAKCDYIVFSDMHLFKKAVPENNGIIVYDETNVKQVVSSLGALYSAIGGPMAEVFGGTVGAHEVKLRRIARNGVEALLDNTHSLLLGDSAFARRYGIVFPDMESSSEGDGILGFAIDGRPAARLCLRYECEPVFEMIAERLSQNGVRCAIETFDPVINGAFVASRRKGGGEAINVIHKNVNDYNAKPRVRGEESTGIVVGLSRLKLAESVVWCKRFAKISRICRIIQPVAYAVALLVFALGVGFNITALYNQYFALALQAICLLPMALISLLSFPTADYFTLESIEAERAARGKKNIAEE